MSSAPDSSRSAVQDPQVDPVRVSLRLGQDLDWVRRRTDAWFARLMPAQWILAIVLAILVAPLRWEGTGSSVSPHLYAALLLGGLLTALPVVLALVRPGQRLTRHVVAFAQMGMGALLIHLTGGRIETHFHVFGSLAFLSFYVDFGVLITATLIVVVDHLLRGFLWPQSVYGTVADSELRFLEHAAWVVFEVAFLLIAVRSARRDKHQAASAAVAREMALASVEQKVSERTAELARSEQLFRTLNQHAPVGIVIVQHDGTVLHVNVRAHAMLQAVVDAQGHIDWARAAEVIGLERARSLWQKVAAGETLTAEHAFPSANGQESRWLHLMGTPLPAETGLSASMLICVDSTDVQQREAAMRAAAEAAEAGHRAKSEFLTAMSHDLRTPLDVVLGHAELLLEDARETGALDRTRDLQEIQSAGQRLLRLISDLLEVARTEAGTTALQIETFDVEPLLREIAVALRPDLEASRNRLVFEVAADLAPCRTDRTKLRRVLMNLVLNWSRLCMGTTIEVHAGCALPPSDQANLVPRLQIRVTGDSLGIEPGEANDPLTPVPDAMDGRSRKGMVMQGFVASERVCRLLGGHLTRQEASDHRTCFVVEVPMSREDSALPVVDPLPSGIAA